MMEFQYKKKKKHKSVGIQSTQASGPRLGIDMAEA